MAQEFIKILLLAAGKSSRMGKPKQLLPVANDTLLGLALKTAVQANVSGVFCVLGANREKIRPIVEEFSVNIVENENWENGLGNSIATGTSAMLEKQPETTGILVLLADQPWVDHSYLEKMLHQFKSDKTPIIASDYGGFYGVPALFPKSYFEQLKNLNGDSGAKELLNTENIPIKVIKSPEKLEDIDTITDYKEFLKSRNS